MDRLSDWALPPGEVEPVRVFDTADDALALLARLNGNLRKREARR